MNVCVSNNMSDTHTQRFDTMVGNPWYEFMSSSSNQMIDEYLQQSNTHLHMSRLQILSHLWKNKMAGLVTLHVDYITELHRKLQELETKVSQMRLHENIMSGYINLLEYELSFMQ